MRAKRFLFLTRFRCSREHMFIKQSLLYDELPFDVTLRNGNDDYFYSKANREHLDRSIAQLKAGKDKLHDLTEVDSND